MLQVRTEKQKKKVLEIFGTHETCCYFPMDFDKKTDWGYEAYDDRIYLDGNITFDKMREVVEYLSKENDEVDISKTCRLSVDSDGVVYDLRNTPHDEVMQFCKRLARVNEETFDHYYEQYVKTGKIRQTMNRKIEFRGKRLDNDKWMYGDLMRDNLGGCYVYPIDAENIYVENKVDPDTVGRYTGLQDKKASDIYEGDIVRWDKDQRLYVVEFRGGMFYASVEPCNHHIYGGFPLWFLCEEEHHCEIIGNIHDNTELLTAK